MTEHAKTEILQVNEAFVMGKCDYFVEVRLWPLTQRLNPKRWLSNFNPDEMNHAVSLLNAFIYFDKILVDQLLLGAFQNLSRLFCGAGTSYLSAQSKWRDFLDTVVVTGVQGEQPNPTDSGYTFLRMARQVVGIPQERILEPQKAIATLLERRTCPVVFLDDFVGSGNQFISTWTTRFEVQGHGLISFANLASMLRNSQFFYCPLVCTTYGKNRIANDCSAVSLHPSHLLSEDYCAFSPDSVIWPAELRSSASDFIQAASSRAGIVNWKGFHALGLAMAFEHSVPDACLPLLYWNENGWKPLIERT